MSRRTECELVLGGMWSLGPGPDQAPFPASRRPYSFPSPPPHHSMAANSFPLSRCIFQHLSEQVLGGLQPKTPSPTQRASTGWLSWSKGSKYWVAMRPLPAGTGWLLAPAGPQLPLRWPRPCSFPSPLRMAAVTALRGKPAATVAFESNSKHVNVVAVPA